MLISFSSRIAVEGLLDFKLAGIAAALLDRAAKLGNNDAGLLGAVIGFHGGIVSVGGEAATTQEPLY